MRLIAISTVFAGLCLAQSISESDRSYGLSALHATRKQVLDATAGMSMAQWNHKPSPEAWSIAQVIEHLALLEEQVPGIIETVMKSPASPEKKAAKPREVDAKILAVLPQRTTKVQAPEPFKPSGKYKDGPAALAAFRAARDRTIAAFRTSQAPLRDHFYKHPALGEIDGMQWYLATAAHSERHVNQILEVKASPGFPKK